MTRPSPYTTRMRAFAKADEGAVLVFFAILFAVMLGMIALAFDTGRMAATQSELQSYADNVALAAAGELDGEDGAIARATAAAAELIDDIQTFGDGGALLGVADYTLTFLSDLPADDTADTSGFVTTNSTAAAYARVVITPRRVATPIAAAFSAITGQQAIDANVGATAIAGFTAYVCDVPVLMFCLPSPTFKAEDNVGSTILLRSGRNGSQWGPGDFGFLDPSDIGVDQRGPCAGLNGVQLDTCLIAASGNLLQCVRTNGVDIEPGQKVGIENAVFNTRFDIYTGTMNNKRNNPHYAPAPHVISGFEVPTKGNQCIGNNPSAGDTMAFPADDCFGSSSGCTIGNGRFGDADWSDGRATYFATNYGVKDATGNLVRDANGNVVLNANGQRVLTALGSNTSPTRYEVYKAEIAAAGTGNILTNRRETGRPQCSKATPNPNPERRTFVAAGINCDPATGGTAIAGAAKDVKPAEFVRVFLTRPVGNSTVSPPVFDLWVEVVESVGGPGGGQEVEAGIFREQVQLYR
ncbi:TadE/TadG family type IV pilus assembly protein [Palleronia sp. KMU-117]|uniref:TadE/TadG family type IV pilus assembly protein n=1 Tax=Palleronia sp. KMU-117 TaxID=3434108 RepID=UPI003D70B9E8